ncbi:hypothetical protein LEMLEM_LOCUS2349 [Lemmus lemmus]
MSVYGMERSSSSSVRRTWWPSAGFVRDLRSTVVTKQLSLKRQPISTRGCSRLPWRCRWLMRKDVTSGKINFKWRELSGRELA